MRQSYASAILCSTNYFPLQIPFCSLNENNIVRIDTLLGKYCGKSGFLKVVLLKVVTSCKTET